jgi:O-antigen/teichoic acid export membrane protein
MMAERIVSFFLLPILTKSLTIEEYAIWTQSIIIVGVLVPIVLLKFETTIIKFLPLLNKNRKKQNSLILFMIVLILCFFSLIAVIILLLDDQIANFIFGDHRLSFYVPLLIVLLFSEVIFEFLIGVLRVANKIKKLSIYLLMKGVWRAGVLILVLIIIDGSYYLALSSFVLFQLIIILFLFFFEINPVLLFKSGLKTSKPYWSKVIKFSLPLVPYIVLLGINNFVDRFFIIHFHGLKLLGIYAAGFSLAVIVTFIHSTISFMLFPELSKLWVNKNKNKNKIKNLIQKVVISYLALSIPFLIFILIAGVDFISLLTTNQYNITSIEIFLITLNIALFGLHQIIYYVVLLDRGSLSAPRIMTIVVFINIVFNALLIPNYGIFGAALAGFLSNAYLAIYTIVLSKKILKWNYPILVNIKILFRSLIMGIVIWQSIHWLGNDLLSLLVTLIFSGFTYILLDFFGDKNSSFISLTKLSILYRRKS